MRSSQTVLELAEEILRNTLAPHFAVHIFSIVDFNAEAGGVYSNTDAIVFSACHKVGGGKVANRNFLMGLFTSSN